MVKLVFNHFNFNIAAYIKEKHEKPMWLVLTLLFSSCLKMKERNEDHESYFECTPILYSVSIAIKLVFQEKNNNKTY